ncbi:hypothetical protein [Paenibacillus ginsengarvi]|uniref:Uncharacterized protein n=1 Tax=Paenibacillus ginsengarvi TaxID=400777 RepID=A0A3B0CM07_9BACL|nr:hypothetical protein [Paenibacillus ginsengarvi]RKN85407.1 hypothetical protein D7M11_06840 [Paenibacillus ginsengarvi]
MEGIVIAIVIVVLVAVVLSVVSAKRKKSPGMPGHAEGIARKAAPPQTETERMYRPGPIPDQLGLAADIPLDETARQLELAFAENFGDMLKRRVLGKYARMSEAEYEWKLLELKRYLLMNTVLKQVPMFSPEVDDIWHEMLMFTREYERFCQHWNGRTIHHAPHGEPVSMQGERAWFDWVYSHLFAQTPYSGRIWRGFFRYPLDREKLDMLGWESEERIAAALFHARAAEYNPEVEETIALLIHMAKEQITRAGAAADSSGMTANRSSVTSSMSGAAGGVAFGALASSMLMFSVLDPERYTQQMEEIMPEEEKRNNASCGSSSCTATLIADDSLGRDGGGTSDGGDSGDSSSDSSSSDSSSSGDSGSSSCSSSSGCGGGGD